MVLYDLHKIETDFRRRENATRFSEFLKRQRNRSRKTQAGMARHNSVPVTAAPYARRSRSLQLGPVRRVTYLVEETQNPNKTGLYKIGMRSGGKPQLLPNATAYYLRYSAS
jgi:hypothetical protein